MCSKRNELWNTSLLFDLNYKFELIGASLLALAKSIYYLIPIFNDSPSPTLTEFLKMGTFKISPSKSVFVGFVLLKDCQI